MRSTPGPSNSHSAQVVLVMSITSHLPFIMLNTLIYTGKVATYYLSLRGYHSTCYRLTEQLCFDVSNGILCYYRWMLEISDFVMVNIVTFIFGICLSKDTKKIIIRSN